MDRIREIFIKLREGNKLWKNNNEEYRGRLEKAFQPFFIELEGLGVDRCFSESLLFFGKEFVNSLDKKSEDLDDNELEEIWGAKPAPESDREFRERVLAEKSGADTWVSLPMRGGRVGIKVLTYKKGRGSKNKANLPLDK